MHSMKLKYSQRRDLKIPAENSNMKSSIVNLQTICTTYCRWAQTNVVFHIKNLHFMTASNFYNRSTQMF